MRRYWRIYKSFFVSAFARELEFRANFIAKIIQNAMWIGFFVLIVLVVYRNTTSVAGWNEGDAFILAATVFLMNALAQGLFFSVQEIPQQIRQGTMDFVILKPIDTQFWVSMRRFNFDQIGSIVGGILMMIFGFSSGHLHPDPLQWLAWLTTLLCALAMFYSLSIILMTTSIWLIRVDNLFVLTESTVNIARNPLDIYSLGVQKLFTYVLPLAFLATIPARFLVGAIDWPMLGLGIVWAAACLIASRTFWHFALSRYASASS